MAGPRQHPTVVRRGGNRTVLAAVALTVLLASLLLPGPAAAQSGSPAHAIAVVQPSTVYIETSWVAYVQDHNDTWFEYAWTSRCSGFVVNPSGYIATAGHCVDSSLDYGASWDAIQFAVDEWIANGLWPAGDRASLLEIAYGNWTVEGSGAGTSPDRTVFVTHGRAVSGLTTATGWSARVVEVKSLNDGDVALLKVEEAQLPTVQLAGGETFGVGTSVLSVGYPGSSDLVADQTLEPTFKDGTISSQRTREGGLLPVYEISAAMTGGMSGGPTVDLNGQVVGVNSFSILGESQQFNFVTPVSLVAEMLSRNGVSNDPGPVDELYREALDSYFAGDYDAAVVGFDRVLDRAPSHQYAQGYRTESARLRGQGAATTEDDSPDVPVPTQEPTLDRPPIAAEEAAGTSGTWALVAVGTGGVLVGVAVAVGLLLPLRRRIRDADSSPT